MERREVASGIVVVWIVGFLSRTEAGELLTGMTEKL